MPPMPHKNAFEPKDPRIINIYDDDDEDDDDLDDWSLTTTSDTTPRPRRRKTGTQALVEFLNTTSPEEFQKSTPKRSSTLFFRRRKNKVPPPAPSSTPTSTPYAPHTIIRKNYIEIVANPLLRTSTSSSTRSQAVSLVSKNSIRPTSTADGPILPSNRSSKRDSSLYSGSLRLSTSIKSQISQGVRRQDMDNSLGRQSSYVGTTSYTSPSLVQKQTAVVAEVATEALVKSLGDMDAVEAGLRQRLERFRLAPCEPPGDMVAHALSGEHVRALQVPVEPTPKKKVRHIQVQTMPVPPNVSTTDLASNPLTPVTASLSTASSTATTLTTAPLAQTPLPETDSTESSKPDVESLERQLLEERQQRQRLEASLEASRDHFEVLSGMAYKKLREIWEEKVRWENAFMELRERWLVEANHHAPAEGHNDFAHSEYCLAEEDEEQDVDCRQE